jgi:hypothetical protein
MQVYGTVGFSKPGHIKFIKLMITETAWIAPFLEKEMQ